MTFLQAAELAQTTALHANERDYWVITKPVFVRGLTANRIENGQLHPPVFSPGGPTRVAFADYCRLRSSPSSEFIVSTGIDTMEVFRLDRNLGQLTRYFQVTSTSSGIRFGSSFGTTICFSSDNSKLYIANTRDVDTTNLGFRFITEIFQYDFSAGGPAQIIASQQLVSRDSAVYRISDMQVALDGKIYFVAQYLDSVTGRTAPIFHLGSIECPNALGTACDVRYNSVYLGGRESGWFLPTQDQTIFRNAAHVQASADPPVLCGGDSTQLMAYGGGATSVRWFPATGLSSDTIPNPKAAPTVTTTYMVIAQRACGTPDTARVRVVVTAGAAVVAAGPDYTLCPGDTVRLGSAAAGPGAAYLWGPARYLNGTRSARPVFTAPVVPRDTVLTYVVRAYCTTLPPDTVRLTIRARPALVPLPDVAACPGDSLTLGQPPLPGAIYSWAPAALLGGAATARPRFRVPARAPRADTTYVFRRIVALPGSPCVATDSVRVRVMGEAQMPDLLAVSVDTMDERRIVATFTVPRPADYPGGSLVLEARAPGQSFAQIGTAPLPLPAAEATLLATAVPGAVYRLSATGACGTVTSAAHRPISLTATPTDSLGGARLQWSAYRGWLGVPRYAVLARLGAETAYAPLWTGTDTTLLVTAAPVPVTRYRVVGIAPSNSRRAASNSVEVAPRPGLLAYNILTPNGDGRNDALVVENLEYYPGTSLTVYSRWGQQVYRAADYRSGAWQAEGLVAGVYYYRLQLPDGRAWQGWVQVVR